MTPATESATNTYTAADDWYEDYLGRIRDRFAVTSGTDDPLFTTDAAGLWESWLSAFPAERRQHYTCHACRRFVEDFGGLVTIDVAGNTTSAVWPADVPEFFAPAVSAVLVKVKKAKVTGVFLSSASTLGQPITGPWHHMAVTLPIARVFRATRLKNADQAAAEKREDRGTVLRALADFSRDHAVTAATITEAEALYRVEKVAGVARWFRDLHLAIEVSGKHKVRRENLVWRAVALAPPGFAHVRSTMIGTLLEDLAAGLPFEDVRRKFAAKMHPLQYRRPTAAPSEGQIAQAEKIVAELGASGSLARRFARLEDIVPLWTPATPTASPPVGGVFGHLTGRAKASPIVIDGGVLTWEKFAREVLPLATSMEAEAPMMGRYIALTTAANPDAPPILQWDHEDRRNPVAWYVYPGGSLASRWNVMAGWVNVNAITLLPPRWSTDQDHHGNGAILILDRCRDTVKPAGAAIFPEFLRTEFHGIRKTIEAYSRSATLEGQPEASACGLDLRKGQQFDQRVRVTRADGSILMYRIDRWD